MISIGKKLLGLIGVMCFCMTGFGQVKPKPKSINRQFVKAINYVEVQDYNNAIAAFRSIIAEVPELTEAYLNLGLCYLNMNTGADSAIVIFKKGLSIQSEEEQKSTLGQDFMLALGEAYQVALQPDSAINVYKQLLSNVSDIDEVLSAEIHKEIQMCENAKVFLANPIKLTIINLGDQVNSSYDDHSPLVNFSQDILFFTSRREEEKLPQLVDGQYPEKVYYSNLDNENWKKAEALKVFFKNLEHESCLSLSADGNTLFIFRNDKVGKSIYVSYYENNEWKQPVKLPYPINTEVNETHASLSGDRSTLFFTSDREGGFGGTDIYMCKKTKYGEWGRVRNLGASVNTQFDEEASMMHPDGETLYFSSEGHNSMGRMDVFYTQMKADSTWALPVNLGYPINTPDDDFFFLPSLNKSEAYYASARFNDNLGGSDIYKVEFDDAFEGELAVIEGVVSDSSALGSGTIRIMVTRRTDKRLVGDYRPNEKDGKYIMFLKPGHEYDIEEKVLDETIKRSHLVVGLDMAYEKENKVFGFSDIRMDPPLQQLIVKKDLELQNEEILDKIINEIKTLEKPHYYTVQVLALKRKPLFASAYLKGLDFDDLRIVKCKDGYTRYIYGAYTGFSRAMIRRAEIMTLSKFDDSFVRSLSDIDELKEDKDLMLTF